MMFLRVRLEAANGELVFHGKILSLPGEWPRVVVWGSRFFLLHKRLEDTFDTPAALESAYRLGIESTYRETVPQVVLPPNV